MKKMLLALAFALLVFGCGTKAVPASFQKIVYHTSGCFGYCPIYHLEVQSDGAIRLHAEKVYKQGRDVDSSRVGFYSGRIDEAMRLKLESELNKISVSKLHLNHTDCCDGVLKTIIIYRNGKREFIREMFEPQELKPLINVLNEICTTQGLKRIEEFELEVGE